jgi:hypothetical protein
MPDDDQKKKPAPPPVWRLDSVLKQADQAAQGQQPKPEEKSFLGSMFDKIFGPSTPEKEKPKPKPQYSRDRYTQ